MKYLCLISAETVMEMMSDGDAKRHYREYAEFTAAIKDSGHFVGGNRLEPADAAATLRVREGRVGITDGPFAETREQIGGYYIIEARDMNEALQVAARIPGAAIGSVEVRPIADDESTRALGLDDRSQRITPFLWFDDQAEAAVDFYLSLFPNSWIRQIVRYDDTSARRADKAPGSVLTIAFELDGQAFTALNGGPHYTLNEAVSFVVNCASQVEIDRYWDALADGGRIQQCGWLVDRFGVTWQIVPTALPSMLADADAARAQRVMQTLLGMQKIDLPALEDAYG